jgi:hypothetical protein
MVWLMPAGGAGPVNRHPARTPAGSWALRPACSVWPGNYGQMMAGVIRWGDYTTRSSSARPAPGAAPAGQPVDMDTTSFTFPLGDGARRHFGEVRAIACSLGARSRYLFIVL